MALMDISARDLSKAMNINEATFYRKLNDDGRFTRDEIGTMLQMLKIEDPTDIFFAEKLTDK